MQLFRDEIPLFNPTPKYSELPDFSQFVVPNALGFGGYGSDTVWDWVHYEICGSQSILVTSLLDEVMALDLEPSVESALVVKLNAASQVLDDGNESNDVAACNVLNAFINSVEAQRGKKISESDADQLIDSALEIIFKLSCL